VYCIAEACLLGFLMGTGTGVGCIDVQATNTYQRLCIDPCLLIKPDITVVCKIMYIICNVML
jgi:hypothetical protein